MGLTLIEAAKRLADGGETFRAGVIATYANSHPILTRLPFENIQGNSLRYNREESLPGIGFRGVNEGYDSSVGAYNPLSEPLVIAGGDLDVDNFILKTMGEGQRSSQEAAKLKALAHRWAHAIIKGDSTTDPKEFDGLQKRLTGDQLVPAGSTANGDPLSLFQLDEAISRVDEPGALIMSKRMAGRFSQAARKGTAVGGHIEFTQATFGAPQMSYAGLQILIADPNGAQYATLAFDEANPNGGTDTGTSIYVVSFGGDRLTGIQNAAPEVRDIGELQSKPSLRSRVEWYAGMAMFHSRAASRLWGIADAELVA